MRAIRIPSSDELTPFRPDTGLAYPSGGSKSVPIIAGRDAAVLEVDASYSSSTARLVVVGPGGATFELVPGDMLPIFTGEGPDRETWNVFQSTGENVTLLPTFRVGIWLWSEREALIRAATPRIVQRRLQIQHNASDIGLGDVPLNVTQTGLWFDASGMRDVTAFSKLTHDSATTVTLELQTAIDDDPLDAYEKCSESTAAGIGTLSQYRRRRAVTGNTNWEANWNVNARRARIIATSADGTVDDLLTVDVICGA